MNEHHHLLRSALIIVAGAAFLGSPDRLSAQDEKQTLAEQTFHQLVGDVPKVLAKSELPSVQEKSKDELYFSKIRVARLVAADRAKITVALCGQSEDKKEGTEYARFTLFLSWYRNAWTVTHHEESKFFNNGDNREHLLKLITDIDALGTQKR